MTHQHTWRLVLDRAGCHDDIWIFDCACGAQRVVARESRPAHPAAACPRCAELAAGARPRRREHVALPRAAA